MKFLLVLLFGLFFSTTYSQSSIRFINNTDNDIYAAYVYWNKSNQSWNSKGWVKIQKYSSRDRDLGNYKGKVYIHGHQSGFLTSGSWGKGWTFCVDDDDAFHFRGVEKINNCKDKANFSELNIARGINKWTFNP